MNTQVESKNIGVVKDFFRLQYEGKIDEAFAKHGHEEFEWIVSSANNEELTAAIPWAGFTHKGAQGYKNFAAGLFGEYKTLQFEVGHYHDIDNIVFAVGSFKFEHYTTGKVADSDFIGFFRMKEGKVHGGQFYENTFAIADCRK